MFTLGVTGGIGSGKSLVTSFFQQEGVFVVDADYEARAVVEPNQPALKVISDHFGNNIITADGLLDRPRLRAKIFDNPQEKQWLEDLLHPLIRNRVNEALTKPKTNPYQIYSAALLLETHQLGRVDKLLIVDCPVEMQIQRVMERDHSTRESVLKIISQQISRNERLHQADYVIDNSGDLEHVRRQVSKTHLEIMALCDEF